MTSKLTKLVSLPSTFLIIVMLDVASSRVLSYTYKVMEIIDDLPVKSDLEKYLSALEKVVYFAEANKFYVDLNVCLGIYLINGKP